jgi:hypothetical protein
MSDSADILYGDAVLEFHKDDSGSEAISDGKFLQVCIDVADDYPQEMDQQQVDFSKM